MRQALFGAFPSLVRSAASKVVAALPSSEHEPSCGFTVRLDGEDIEIPGRIYNPELPEDITSVWTEVERDLYACLYTRHHDGYVRQRHVGSVTDVSTPWVVPFMVKLIGEYVVEIVADIQRRLSDVESPGSSQWREYGTFVAANPAFVDLTSARVISYWDCYYRSEYPMLTDYPGFQLISSLKRVGAQHA